MEIFGDVLLTKDGEKATSDVLKGKVVGIYFSAHWCPPCRGFTPKLAEWYKRDLQGKGLEIVFVSSDRDEKSFEDYYGEMLWAALPFQDKDRKAALDKKFKVQGIPTLVLLDSDGKLITKDGREAVSSDPTGAEFPWKPAKLSELLECEVQTGDGDRKPLSSVAKDKVLGIYFSAHWCPPCRGYTPQLAKKYEEIKAAGLPFEIMFASSDRDEESFESYFKEHPWVALPFAERQLKEKLSKHFGVRGIPTLVLLDKDRSVITTEGRGAVMGDLADFPFHPKPVKDLSKETDGINESPSVIVLAEKADSTAQSAAFAALEPLAAEYMAAAKAAEDDPEFMFFVAKDSDGPASQIRKLCELPEPTSGPVLMLLDIPDQGGYYTPEGYAVTSDGVRALLADYKAKKLTRKQMSN
jgi:nucleoredoxin